MNILRRRWILAVSILLSWPAIGSTQSGWNAEALMRDLAMVKEAELTFVEFRTSTFLIDEIRLTGRLRYRAPDFIEKSVESPYLQVTTIDGDSISIQKTSGRGQSDIRHYSLTSSEALQTAVEGIRATLSGNYAYLKESYELELTGDRDNWSVTLVPRAPGMKEVLEKIRVSGGGGRITDIDTTKADGDESRLSLSYQNVR